MTNKKQPFQSVSFRTVEEFLDYLPPDELKMVETLRAIVYQCIPGCKEKLAYNVPFYYRFARVCFIWPSAIPWGKSKYHGVRLGFANGNLLKDEINYLSRGERKQVFWRDFYHLSEIEPDIIKSFIFQSVEVDEQLHKAKKQ